MFLGVHSGFGPEIFEEEDELRVDVVGIERRPFVGCQWCLQDALQWFLVDIS